MSNLEIKLSAMNLAKGVILSDYPISCDYFDKLQDELINTGISVNGVHLQMDSRGYLEISEFLKKLAGYENQPLEVIAAVVNTPGLIKNLGDVFHFCDNKIIEVMVSNDTLTPLSDIVGDQWSQDQLKSILDELPERLHDALTHYFDHEKYKADLFLNELNYIKHNNVEIVYSKRNC